MAWNHSIETASTACVHAGRPGARPGPLLTPLVQSTTFVQEHVGATTDAYSRVSNPTVQALETALGHLEDAPDAVTFSSGIGAETALLLSLLQAGDHVICGRTVYGGTIRLLQDLLSSLGVRTSFVDTTEPTNVESAITPATKLVFIETPANPTLELTDIRQIAAITHDVGALLVVDNTFLTPVLQRPLDLGADVCVYSTTKFIDGHSAALGGALVSRNRTLLERFRFVRKSTGGIQTPFNAWLTLQGLKTLPLRIVRQSETAATIATWLDAHPWIARVNYPGLSDSSITREQHLGADGAVLSLEVAGGDDAARDVLNGVSLCSLVEHVGSVETLITHPASMTHADVPREQRLAVGIPDGLIRLSVGLESPDDIIADLDAALRAAHETREEVLACPALV
ncbi:MAG: aminotransferase class I/II-fold pyridoxal phosphate-dependent enzyme [Planctomycetota bacterium]